MTARIHRTGRDWTDTRQPLRWQDSTYVRSWRSPRAWADALYAGITLAAGVGCLILAWRIFS